jgi:hypothetical protein
MIEIAIMPIISYLPLAGTRVEEMVLARVWETAVVLDSELGGTLVEV